MLKSEEGAINAGFINRKSKFLNTSEAETSEEEIDEIKTILGYESTGRK